MAFNNRVIIRTGSTLTDISQQMNNYLSGTQLLNINSAATDALYLGSDLAFNHRWFDIRTGNIEPAQIDKIEIWNGSAWQNTVDVIDETSTGGSVFAQSGYVAFVPDRYRTSWNRENSTETIPDLSQLRIYDLYWVKLTFTAPLSTTTELSYIGHRFANDVELKAEYPELFSSDLLNALGVSGWGEKHAVAAEYLIRDLIRENSLYSSNQILDWEIFKSAGVHRAAAMIYYMLGPAYNEHYLRAMTAYKSALDMKNLRLDQNNSGDFDMAENHAVQQHWLRR